MIIFTILPSQPHSLQTTLESLMDLSNVDWLLVYKEPADVHAAELLRLMAYADERIVRHHDFLRSGVEAEFVVPLIEGDQVLPAIRRLHEDGLPAGCLWAYADSVIRTGEGDVTWAKPDFSPELQLATNFIQRPIFAAPEMAALFIRDENDVYAQFAQWQEKFGAIFHLQDPVFSMERLFTDEKEHLERCTATAEKMAHGLGYRDFSVEVKSAFSAHLGRDFSVHALRFPDHGPKITLIIPTKDHCDLLRTCIDSILAKTSYRNYSILVIDNDSVLAESREYFSELARHPQVDVITISNPPGGGFNYAHINNVAVQRCDAELVCFLNNDTEIVEPGWLAQLVGVARNGQVGSAGALLFYPNMVVQHSGIRFGLLYNKLPVTAFKHLAKKEDAYAGMLFAMHNYLALSAACLAMRRQTFLDAGGFDAKSFAVAYNDCDLGLRLHGSGLRNVFCPDAALIHHEGYTRGTGIGNDNPKEEAEFLRRYDTLVDPFYNRWLAADSSNCEVRRMPRYPAGPRSDARAILVYTHNLNFEGAPLVLFDLVRALSVHSRYRFIVLSPVTGPLAARYRDVGAAIRICPDLGHGGTHNEASFTKFIGACVDEIETLGVDMVIANTVLAYHFVVAAIQADKPAFWVIHESEPPFTHLREHGGVAEYFARRAAHDAELVFVCESTREYYKHQLGVKHNTSVIYNAVDFTQLSVEKKKLTKQQARRKLKLETNHRIGLCVGTVCARKRQQDIVEIVRRLSDGVAENLTLVIVGDRTGEYSDELHQQVRSLGQRAKCVTIIAETPNPFPYFIAADFFLFCSGMESYPRVLQEALFFELPVVTTRVFGNREIVSENRNALCFESGDTAAAAAHVERLCTDQALFDALKSHCAPALGRFSTTAKFADSYADLIDSAMGQRARAIHHTVTQPQHG